VPPMSNLRSWGSGDEGGASKLISNWREKMIGALCESKKECDDPLVADPIRKKKALKQFESVTRVILCDVQINSPQFQRPLPEKGWLPSLQKRFHSFSSRAPNGSDLHISIRTKSDGFGLLYFVNRLNYNSTRYRLV
jgi:hypothetical protein